MKNKIMIAALSLFAATSMALGMHTLVGASAETLPNTTSF